LLIAAIHCKNFKRATFCAAKCTRVFDTAQIMIQSRFILRKHLHLARKANDRAYLILVDHYLNLVTEYLKISGLSHPKEIVENVKDIFIVLWKCLPFTKRLSDFEHLICLVLQSTPHSCVPPQQTLLGKKILQLDCQARFLLVAHEMEQWDSHWQALALRKNPRTIKKVLLKIRCLLCDIDYINLSQKSQQILLTLSNNLDITPASIKKSSITLPPNQKIIPEINHFKANWLDMRCQIIELRQQIRLNPETREAFFRELTECLIPDQMINPRWVEILCNKFSFRYFPELKPLKYKQK
jgi:hypothetical protein